MIRILIDSSSDYSLEEATACGVELIPLQVLLDEKSYRDGIDLTKDEFYNMLIASGGTPKTSQPTPENFLTIFEDVKAKGDEMVCLLISSGLSGTFQNAMFAKESIDYDGIHLVDSKSAACGLRILIEKACQLRDAGSSAFEIARETTLLCEKIRIFFAVDTLEYLYRGGRLSKASAAIGELAKVKPLLTLNSQGKIEIAGKFLGMGKALSALVSKIQSSTPDTDYPCYMLYSYGKKNCELLDARLEGTPYHSSQRVQVGATLGAHTGPELTGFVFIAQ